MRSPQGATSTGFSKDEPVEGQSPGQPGTGAATGAAAGCDNALQRFGAALDRLESAVEARLEEQAALGESEAEVQRMGADRTRLAEALDAAEARGRQLENTNREVSNRLVNAMEAIRQVLDEPRSDDG